MLFGIHVFPTEHSIQPVEHGLSLTPVNGGEKQTYDA